MLDPVRLVLSHDGRSVPIGNRAITILSALAQKRGVPLDKRELMQVGWPGLFVDEGNLRVQVATIRRALGATAPGAEDLIKNIPGRGYVFIGGAEPAGHKLAPKAAVSALPPMPQRLYGRDDLIDILATKVMERSLVTLVGAGGIGKTTMAIAVGHAATRLFAGGATFVDLASITDANVVVDKVRAAAGSDPGSQFDGDSDAIALVVLDNCEHLIGAAAAAADELTKSGWPVRILATSREPLRLEGEWVHRLAPLETPSPTSVVDAGLATRNPAMRLFFEAAGGELDVASATDDDLRLVAEICTRLDGIPLAIELAASHLAFLGLEGVAKQLLSPFMFASEGLRNAKPRQQTLQATLQWSYDLLGAEERELLKNVSVFRGYFVPDDVLAIWPGTVDEADVLRLLDRLVQKSLVQVSRSRSGPKFRLLQITRQFAEKMLSSIEQQDLSKSHAVHLSTLLTAADYDVQRSTNLDDRVDDLRAALDWAFSDRGEEDIGLSLSVAAAPIWEFTLNEVEGKSILERGLERVTRGGDPESHRRISLFATLVSRLLYMRTGGNEISAAWKNSFDVAKGLDDQSFRIWSVWGAWLNNYMTGRHLEALNFANQCVRLAEKADSPADLSVGRLMVGISQFITANPAEALANTEALIGLNAFPASRQLFVRFQWDPSSVARCYHADALWVLGQKFAAAALVAKNVSISEATGHIPTLWNALAHGACPISIRSGELESAGRFVDKLREISLGNELWTSWARAYGGALLVRAGQQKSGLEEMDTALAPFPAAAFGHRLLGLRCLMIDAQINLGLFEAAEDLLLDSLARAKQRRDLWCFPELVRLRSQFLLARDGRKAFRNARRLLSVGHRYAQSRGMTGWQERIEATQAVM